jgi:hypothetical protein
MAQKVCVGKQRDAAELFQRGPEGSEDALDLRRIAGAEDDAVFKGAGNTIGNA